MVIPTALCTDVCKLAGVSPIDPEATLVKTDGSRVPAYTVYNVIKATKPLTNKHTINSVDISFDYVMDERFTKIAITDNVDATVTRISNMCTKFISEYVCDFYVPKPAFVDEVNVDMRGYKLISMPGQFASYIVKTLHEQGAKTAPFGDVYGDPTSDCMDVYMCLVPETHVFYTSMLVAFMFTHYLCPIIFKDDGKKEAKVEMWFIRKLGKRICGTKFAKMAAMRAKFRKCKIDVPDVSKVLAVKHTRSTMITISGPVDDVKHIVHDLCESARAHVMYI